MIKRIPDIMPSTNKKIQTWHDSSRRLLCDWCGVNVDLYMLSNEIICCDCVEKLKEEKE